VEKTVEIPGFQACCRRFNPEILGSLSRRIPESLTLHGFSAVINVTIV
jgi:hypothetical protein